MELSADADQPRRPSATKPLGPWQAWVGAALACTVTLVYVSVVTAEGIVAEDVWTVAGVTASLIFASVCALGAALSRTALAALVLLGLAVVPLLAWGVLSMGMGPAFLVAAGFLIAALVKVAPAARAR